MAQAAGIIGIGATLAGGILSAQGAEQQGTSTQQYYNYQAGVARLNAQIDLQNRDYALHAGDVESVQYGIQAGERAGQIRAAQGASGLDVNSGTAVQVRQSQRSIALMDENQIRENAAKTAYDYTVRSQMDTSQATLDVMAGENAKKAGDIQAAASILGTVGSVASKWMQGSQSGLWGGSGAGSGGGGGGGFNPFNVTGSLY